MKLKLKEQNKDINIPESLPFLESICWQTRDIKCFTLSEMLSRYERGWKYRGVLADIEGEELEFVRELAKTMNSWIIHHV
jgi:hypothetical protein